MTRGLTLSLAAAIASAALGASAQAFHIERDFAVLRDATGRAYPNVYFVSIPILHAMPDVADSGAAGSDKCVGDPGGPSAPDGVVDVDDLLCALWTSRVG